MTTQNTVTIDTATHALYNQNDVDVIVAGAVERAIRQYENRRSNLDNRIQQSEDAIPLLEGAEQMNHLCKGVKFLREYCIKVPDRVYYR